MASVPNLPAPRYTSWTKMVDSIARRTASWMSCGGPRWMEPLKVTPAVDDVETRRLTVFMF